VVYGRAKKNSCYNDVCNGQWRIVVWVCEWLDEGVCGTAYDQFSCFCFVKKRTYVKFSWFILEKYSKKYTKTPFLMCKQYLYIISIIWVWRNYWIRGIEKKYLIRFSVFTIVSYIRCKRYTHNIFANTSLDGLDVCCVCVSVCVFRPSVCTCTWVFLSYSFL